MLTPYIITEIDYDNKKLDDIYLRMGRTKAQISFHNYERVQELFQVAFLEMLHVRDEIRKLGFEVNTNE